MPDNIDIKKNPKRIVILKRKKTKKKRIVNDVNQSSNGSTKPESSKKRKTIKKEKKDLNTSTIVNIEMPKTKQSISNTQIKPVSIDETNTMSKTNTLRLNETYTELMMTLAYVMRYNKDFMRARAYNNAHETISTYVGDITSPEQLKGLKGIGNTIYQKLIDYKETGTLKVLERNKHIVEKKKAIDVFSDIYGVGEKKAEDLVDKGIKTITDLEKRKD